MDQGYAIRNKTLTHFITITVVDWTDVFSRKVYRDEVINSLDYCTKHKIRSSYSYVISSNHGHIIGQSKEGNLSDLNRDFKKFTARASLHKIQTEPDVRSLRVAVPIIGP